MFPALLLVVWEAVVRYGVIAPNLLPPPSDLIVTVQQLSVDGVLYQHILVSVLRVLGGFAIGAGLP
jgi:sulfonate transport system permease protein